MVSPYARDKNRRILQMLLLLCTMLLFTACNKNTTDKEAVTIKELEEASTESEEHETGEAQEAEKEEEPQRPSREEVLAMRQAITAGMSEEEIARITENIKVANLTMEKAYLYDSLFERLEDSEDLYWNYVDQKGEIQIGWDVSEKPYVAASGLSRREWGEKYGKPIMEYNRFDADNFIMLMEEMRDSLQTEWLKADFDELISCMELAKDTHDVEYMLEIYRILHDMDYFLFRYGIEDMGNYVDDISTISKYYGVLSVYAEAVKE